MTRRYSDQPGYNCYDHENGLEKSAQKYFQLTPPGPLGTAQAFVNTTAYDLHFLHQILRELINKGVLYQASKVR